MSILAGEVRATSPSIPAVLRPALRCVACRTLISVFDQLRSISFCRFLTLARSPSCAALKIRCRSRRTLSSWSRQSMASQSETRVLWSVHHARCPTCPSVPVDQTVRLQRLTCPRQPLSRPGTRPGIRPVIQDRPPGGAATLVSVSCRLSATGIRFLGILFPPRNSALLTVGLPARQLACRTRTGFPCSARVRHDWGGCPLYPGDGGVHTAANAPGRRLPLRNGRPCLPGTASRPGELR